jgi:hypothetical protein
MAASVRAAAGELEVATPQLLFDTRSHCDNMEGACFDITPDGGRFLVLEAAGPAPPLALMQNWTAAVKK